MNYLAHLFLSSDDPQEQLGSLIADFTRGRLETLAKTYPPGVMHGIALHRQIDRFTDENHWVRQSKRRFSAPYRRYSGIILDILHDHFLSCYWSHFTDRGREAFIREVYQLLTQRRSDLPERLSALVPRMQEEDWLGSYLDLEVVDRVYHRMAQRLRQPQALDGAIDQVRRYYPELAQDFRQFFPQLIGFVKQQDHSLRQPTTG